jgi:hypothetical protein
MRWVLPLIFLLAGGCPPKEEPIKSPFTDNFERAELGSNYLNTGGPYQIVNGKLNIKGAYNHPLWLKKKLPRDAVIELDVMSKTPDGDIKVEAWGDGQSYATTRGAYLATSYVFIFGGWGNSVSALCRMDEHADDRKSRSDLKVQPNRTYHFKIQRKGRKVEWFVDGKPFLSLDDSAPLEGDNHAYLGFNNWQSDLYFDNLRISPL